MTADTTRITLLTKTDCAFCDHAKAVLVRVGAEYSLTVTEVGLDSEQGRQLATKHGVLFAPGIMLDGQAFGYGRLSEQRLRKELARRVFSGDR